MTVWIAGCNGYIGKSLSEYLEEREYDVRGIGRGSSLPIAFKYSDVIINCACRGWKDGDEDPLEVVESNILLPMDLDKRRNGAVMIHLSSGIELVQPFHYYAATKGIASRMLNNRAHVLYLYTIWGGRHVQMNRFMSSLIKACAKNLSYTIETPLHTRDFVHIDTLCGYIERLLYDRNYRTTHVGTGIPVTMAGAYDALCKIAGQHFGNVSIGSDRSSFLYHSPVKTLPDTLLEDMKREWEIVIAS